MPPRFLRPPGIVQPHVHALHQVPADVDVVILDEHQPAEKRRVAREIGDLLQHPLAGHVLRMRLPCEDNLDRHLRLVHQRDQRLEILQQQVGALVGREAPGEADGERVERQGAAQLRKDGDRFAPPFGLHHRTPAREVDQGAFNV